MSKVGNATDAPSHTGTLRPFTMLVRRGMLPLSSLVARALTASIGAVGYEKGSKSKRRSVCHLCMSATCAVVEFLN